LATLSVASLGLVRRSFTFTLLLAMKRNRFRSSSDFGFRVGETFHLATKLPADQINVTVTDILGFFLSFLILPYRKDRFTVGSLCCFVLRAYLFDFSPFHM
jgi:hypothetical protein